MKMVLLRVGLPMQKRTTTRSRQRTRTREEREVTVLGQYGKVDPVSAVVLAVLWI